MTYYGLYYVLLTYFNFLVFKVRRAQALGALGVIIVGKSLRILEKFLSRFICLFREYTQDKLFNVFFGILIFDVSKLLTL